MTYLADCIREVHANPTHAALESLLLIATQVENLELAVDDEFGQHRKETVAVMGWLAGRP